MGIQEQIDCEDLQFCYDLGYSEGAGEKNPFGWGTPEHDAWAAGQKDGPGNDIDTALLLHLSVLAEFYGQSESSNHFFRLYCEALQKEFP